MHCSSLGNHLRDQTGKIVCSGWFLLLCRLAARKRSLVLYFVNALSAFTKLFLFLHEALSSPSKFFTIKDNKTLQYFIKWHPELFLQALKHKSDWDHDSNKGKGWGKFTSLWSSWIFAISENLESIHCNKKLAGT